MKRENKLEREYREMMTQAAPDLWERIESGLADHTAENSGETEPQTADGTGSERKESGRMLRMPKRRLYEAATAVAAVLVILAALPRTFERIKDNENTSGSMIDGGVYNAAFAGGAPEMADGAAQGQAAAGVAENGMETMPETAAGAADSTETVPAALITEMEEETVAEPGDAAPAEETAIEGVYAESDLKDTRLLCQVTIRNMSRENKADGRPYIRYEASADDIFYRSAEPDTEAVNKGDSIIIEMPADGTEDWQRSFLMKAGASYIVPLAERDSALEPVFPDEPQIERIEDGGYCFPSLYVSLTDANSAIMQSSADEDRESQEAPMFIRKDETFIEELVGLIEKYADFSQ